MTLWLLLLLQSGLLDVVVPVGEFIYVPQTNCNDGILLGVDLLKFETTICARTADRPDIVSWTRQKHNASTTICQLSLKTDCVSTVPSADTSCYCLKVDTHFGQHLLIGFRQVPNSRYSNISVSAVWMERQTFHLPVAYDVNSTHVGYLQGRRVTSYPTPCHFPVAPDDAVTYCCKDTAHPCVSSVEYEGSWVSQGKACAVVHLPKAPSYFTEPFTFHHNICQHPGPSFQCRAVRKEDTNITTVTHHPLEGQSITTFLAIICFLVISILMTPAALRCCVKRSPQPSELG